MKCSAAFFLALLALVSCGSRFKAESLRKEAVTAQLEMHRDTLSENLTEL